MNTGERVFHRQLGWGTVQRVLHNGPKSGAWVDFGYTKEFLRTEELQTADQVEKRPASRKVEPERKVDKPEPEVRFGVGTDWESVQAAGAKVDE